MVRFALAFRLEVILSFEPSRNTLYFATDQPRAGIGDKAIRGGGIVVATQIMVTVIRLAATIALARLLNPADFGLLAMVVSVGGALLIFKDLGLCDAIIQWPSINQNQVSAIFWVNLAVGMATTLLMVGLSPVVAWFYGEPRLVAISITWSLVFVLGAASAQHLALLKRSMRFSGVSVLSVFAVAGSNLVAILLAWYGIGYWSLVAREILLEIVIVIGAWYLCHWRPSPPSREEDIRPFLTFGGQTILSFLLRRGVRNLDRALIGWRFGAQAVGYYHKAFELAALPASQVSDSLRNVAVSALSKVRQEPAVFQRYYFKSLRSLAFIGFCASAFFVVFSEDIVLVLLGPKWHETSRLFRILGLSTGSFMVYLTHIWLHFSLGRADRLARWSLVEAFVLSAALLTGLPFGAVGIAWAYTLAIHGLMFWGLRYAGAPINLNASEIFGTIWRYMAAAAGAGAISWLMVTNSGFHAWGYLTRILISGLCLVLAYIGLALVLFRGSRPLHEMAGQLKSAWLMTRSGGK